MEGVMTLTDDDRFVPLPVASLEGCYWLVLYQHLINIRTPGLKHLQKPEGVYYL